MPLNFNEERVEELITPIMELELIQRWEEIKCGRGVILTQSEFDSQCEVED